MRSSPNRRVLYDGEAFIRHRRSGITRYLAELITEFAEDPSHAVTPVTPFRYVANAHLVDAASGGYRHVPVPGRWRVPLLGRMNRGAERRVGDGAGWDLVHHSLYEPPALERWAGGPRVCTVYDFNFELHPEHFGDTAGLLADKERFLAACDALICISETTASDLRRVHPDLDKPVFVTPLAAGAEFFEPARSPIRGLPERYLLNVGNRHPHKNVDVLLRAFAAMMASDPDLHLVLCGAHLPSEPARLRELGIAERTHVLRASDAQLPWLYSRAEAFVFTSLCEGFGLPAVEAMAAGCPVVLSDIPALVEVADDAALYFRPDDVEGLVACLQRVVGDETLRKDLITRGSARAAGFTWKRTAELTAAAYDRAVLS